MWWSSRSVPWETIYCYWVMIYDSISHETLQFHVSKLVLNYHMNERGAITIASNACCLQGVFNPNMRFTAKPWLIENSFWNSTTNRRNMFLLFSLLATANMEIQELREILQEIATILIFSWNISLYLDLDWFHNQSWPWKTMRRTKKELLRGIIPCDVL